MYEEVVFGRSLGVADFMLLGVTAVYTVVVILGLAYVLRAVGVFVLVEKGYRIDYFAGCTVWIATNDFVFCKPVFKVDVGLGLTD